MRPTCAACRHYRHDPITDRAVAARKAAGAKARGPMLRARPGGYCHRLEAERGRDLVDSTDWCTGWESRDRRDVTRETPRQHLLTEAAP